MEFQSHLSLGKQTYYCQFLTEEYLSLLLSNFIPEYTGKDIIIFYPDY